MTPNPPCPDCKTDVLVDRLRAPDGERFVCHGCEQTFEASDVPLSMREGSA